MIRKEYPALGECCWFGQLPNGLQLRVVPKPGFAHSFAFFAADYGAIDTAFVRNGIRCVSPDGTAHYLEHKMFDLPQDNAMQQFAKAGGNPNAFTGYSMTAYHFDCTENFEKNLEILLTFVSTPYFTEESVEKERGIIAQEIRMYNDSAETRVYENQFAAMYDCHPIRIPIAGTVGSIEAITADQLLSCYKAFYDPSNMILCVAGDVDPEAVYRLAARVLPPSAGDSVRRDYGAPERLDRPVQRVAAHMDIAMPTFSIGFRCAPPEKGPDTMRMEILGDLAAEILAGESSALYTALYECGKIDSDFSIGYESVRGIAMLSASGDSEVPDEIAAALLDEAARIGREGFDEALFLRLKKSALGRRTRDLDSFESICYRICAGYFDGADYLDFPALYDSVTPAQVQAFLRDTVRDARMCLSVIYPNGEGSEC